MFFFQKIDVAVEFITNEGNESLQSIRVADGICTHEPKSCVFHEIVGSKLIESRRSHNAQDPESAFNYRARGYAGKPFRYANTSALSMDHLMKVFVFSTGVLRRTQSRM